MKPDLYTKAVLTVIAIALAMIACNQYVNPPRAAKAEGAFAGVQYDGGSGVFSLFDPRSGDVWIYYAPNSGKGQMPMSHAKLAAPGSPATYE